MAKLVGVVVLALLIVSVFFYLNKNQQTLKEGATQVPAETAEGKIGTEPEVLASNLEIPWEIAFLSDGRMLVTERPGQVLLLGTSQQNYEVKEVAHIGEGGLLGMALDPDFVRNSYLYLYFTYRDGENTLNKVQRFIFKNDNLSEDKVIIDKIPGANNHDGGRIAFGPDKALYITTGDAQNTALSQDLNSLAGKILRYDGDKVEVYSYGHRNPQGLAWDETGNLWITEHGPSGVGGNCCRDEINLVKKGSNYGWPESNGDKVLSGTVAPFLHSGNTTTWAPSGATISEGKLYFAGLRGEAIYEFNLSTKELKTFFKGEYGRLRSINLGPDGAFYILTSNRDGRGSAEADDDRIIKITAPIL